MILRYRREIAAGLALAGLFAKKARWPLALTALGIVLMPRTLGGFEGKSVIITGGSRGLGLALARKLLNQGAKVTVIARDAEELDRCEQLLCKEFPEMRTNLFTLVCDITEANHLDTAFAETRARFGRIDVLINNAGAITVGPFPTIDNEDFTAQIRLHLGAVVNAVRLIRPYFHQAGSGMIINVSSLGGVIPVPHMTAYCASKFALGGFSESVAAELAQENIQVTTVYPGLMRTGSPIQAVFKGDHAREFAWFASSDNAPLLSISAEQAATRILGAALDGRRHIVLTAAAQMGAMVKALLPETFHLATALANHFLPDGRSHERRTGAMSDSDIPKAFRERRHEAEVRQNQSERRDADFNLGLHQRPQPV